MKKLLCTLAGLVSLNAMSQLKDTIPFEISNLTNRRDHFRNVQFQDNRIAFPISKCDFIKVTIENVEEIEIADISISFTDCHIKENNIDKIASKNISILLNCPIVSCKVNDRRGCNKRSGVN